MGNNHENKSQQKADNFSNKLNADFPSKMLKFNFYDFIYHILGQPQ